MFYFVVSNVWKCFENIYHVYAAVLAIVDLVVSDDRAAVRPNLNSCQGITVDVVPFNETSAITENIHSTLVTIKDGVAPVFGQNTTFQDVIQLYTSAIQF